MTQTDEARLAVIGANILDAVYPGWERKVNLGRLRLEDGRSCILGQLYGWYGAGLISLGLRHGWESGFSLWASETVSYKRLTAAWKVLIRQRRQRRGGRAARV